jgi:hypothetical protein
MLEIKSVNQQFPEAKWMQDCVCVQCSVGLENAWPLENTGKWIRVKLKILILCSGSVDLKILLTVDSCEMKTKIGETEASCIL